MSKVCVVAGVGPGNGASCCRRFAAEGYSIAMLARNTEYLNSLAAEVDNSLAIACDVRDPKAVVAAFDQISNELGEVDVLIYNAGSGEWNNVEQTTIEGMESSWQTNTLGLLVAGQQVIPAMKTKETGQLLLSARQRRCEVVPIRQHSLQRSRPSAAWPNRWLGA